MTEDKSESDAGQDAAALGPLDPFLVLSRSDGSFSVAARAEDGVISLAPLILLPPPPKRRMISCPCCGRTLVWSEFSDGHATLEPLSKPPHDNGDESR